ncbi:hypothetical protein Rs2_28571 [Raphanus sativus]|nr:hypothetical protein Rs2_28571 [Raphanus sativus]
MGSDRTIIGRPHPCLAGNPSIMWASVPSKKPPLDQDDLQPIHLPPKKLLRPKPDQNYFKMIRRSSTTTFPTKEEPLSYANQEELVKWSETINRYACFSKTCIFKAKQGKFIFVPISALCQLPKLF